MARVNERKYSAGAHIGDNGDGWCWSFVADHHIGDIARRRAAERRDSRVAAEPAR